MLSRRLLTRTVSERLRAYPLAAGVMAAVEERPRAIIVLLRLSPVLPSPVNCYMLGLTRVGAPTYLAATVVGAAPNWAFTVYVGSLLKHVAGAVGGGGAPPWPLLAVGIAATAAVLAVVSRLARAKMAELADPGAVALLSRQGRRAPLAVGRPAADGDAAAAQPVGLARRAGGLVRTPVLVSCSFVCALILLVGEQ